MVRLGSICADIAKAPSGGLAQISRVRGRLHAGEAGQRYAIEDKHSESSREVQVN
jgi:hypothetical protein